MITSYIHTSSYIYSAIYTCNHHTICDDIQLYIYINITQHVMITRYIQTSSYIYPIIYIYKHYHTICDDIQLYKNITQHVMITLYIYIHIYIHLSIYIQLYIHKHHTTCDDNACDNMCCRYCNNITGAFTRATIYFPDPVVTHAKHIVVHIHIFFHIFSSTADLFFIHIYFFQIYIYFQILSSLIQRFSVC